MSSSETLEFRLRAVKDRAAANRARSPLTGEVLGIWPERLARFRIFLRSDATRCLRLGFGRRFSKVSVLFSNMTDAKQGDARHIRLHYPASALTDKLTRFSPLKSPLCRMRHSCFCAAS